MARREFSKQVKREALRRAQGHCEATGEIYGLAPGQRCNATLSHGFDFDHAIADGIGGEPTLENAVCACRVCHKFKTAHHDVPRIAKTVRQRDKHLGIKARSTFPKRVNAWSRT